MKNLIRKSLVIAVMLTAMVSYANGFVNTNKEIGEVINIAFKNVTEGSVLIIKAANGIILYKETIKIQGDYSKEFDLTTLPDGNYLFELDKEFEIKLIPFKVKASKVDFSKEKQSVIFKPATLVKEGILKLQFLNLNTTPVYLKIYYINGDLVYKAKFEDKKTISKNYDFSTSLKGKYNIVLSTENRTFIKEVEI